MAPSAEAGEAVAEGDLGIARGEYGAIGDGLLEELRVVVFLGDVALKEDVGMGVHKAGKNGGVRKIDEFDASRRSATRSDADDFVAFDEDQRVGDGRVALAVNQMAGANREFFRRRGGLFLG
jgi:hypothetical protein